MRKLVSIALASTITAAFIGPGTVTTAARAGASHRLALLWSLLFATIACYLLQEAAARLTAASGKTLGEAIRARFGAAGGAFAVAVASAVVLGCAAYQAGNILGAVAGAELLVDAPRWLLTATIAAAAFTLLATGGTRGVVGVLSALVAVMGVGFVVTAVFLRPDPLEIARGLVVPAVPAGSGLLVLGLVGTTVVPYNLFLGSGLARGQTTAELRFGLAVAIGLGGLVSMAVLVVGQAATEPFGFEPLAAVLATELGPWARGLFALGLFAAGFTSAVTAPWAAALACRSSFGADDPRWGDGGTRYRAVWVGVLAFGLLIGLSGAKPIPVILLAQALNGVLLPLVAVFLLVAINDRRWVGDALSGPLSTAATALAVALTLVLGLRGALGAATTAASAAAPSERTLLLVSAALAALVAIPVGAAIRRGRVG